MKWYFKALVLVLAAFISVTWAQEEKDVEGGKDHPLFTRMPGYYLSSFEEKDFDSYEPSYLSGNEARWEGKTTKLEYTLKAGAKPVSMIQIVRNYQNAAGSIGGKILSSETRVTNLKIQKGGAVTYAHVEAFNDGRNYELVIVETKPMAQEVTADANSLNRSLAATGKVAVYGIYFDTGKSILKPESDPTLEEIVKLLRNDARLQLYVVGHTDSVGTLESNLKLSAERAAAVVKAVVGRGIEPTRLKSAGVGPYCPETSNKTEEGKAKNRRVELVEQN